MKKGQQATSFRCRPHTEVGNRRNFLARSTAGLGVLALADLLDSRTLPDSVLAHADSVNPVPKKRGAAAPIELSWFVDNETLSVRMRSRMFSPQPELVFNMEACVIAVLPEATSPPTSFRTDLPPVIGPPSMLVHTPLQPGGAERNPAVTAGSLPGLAAGSPTRCAGELCYTPAAIPQSTPSLPARCKRSLHSETRLETSR